MKCDFPRLDCHVTIYYRNSLTTPGKQADGKTFLGPLLVRTF